LAWGINRERNYLSFGIWTCSRVFGGGVFFQPN